MIRFFCECGRPCEPSEGDVGSSARCPLCRMLAEQRTTDFVPAPSEEITPVARLTGVIPQPSWSGHESFKKAPTSWLGRGWEIFGTAAIVFGIMTIVAALLLPSGPGVKVATSRILEQNNLKQI